METANERYNAQRRKRRQMDGGRIRRLEREQYERDKERTLTRMATEYANNPEPRKLRSKQRYWKNPTKAKTAAKQWRLDHPEVVKDMRQRNESTRRARKLDQFIEDVDRDIVYQMHGGMCGICEQFVPEDDFHVDHVIPLSKGGMHGYVNVQPAHPFCNRSKGGGYDF